MNFTRKRVEVFLALYHNDTINQVINYWSVKSSHDHEILIMIFCVWFEAITAKIGLDQIKYQTSHLGEI